MYENLQKLSSLNRLEGELRGTELVQIGLKPHILSQQKRKSEHVLNKTLYLFIYGFIDAY